MPDYISPTEFEKEDGLEDWRVVGDGACAFFNTRSLAESARFVTSICTLPGAEEHRPDIDLRRGGVTVRLLTTAVDYYGTSQRDVDLARHISGAARELGLASDPSAVQSVLVVPGGRDVSALMPFWEAVLGYARRPDSPQEDLVDPRDRGPAFWFERMAELRGDGGGAVHIAVWIPADQAEARIAAALAAGGRMVRDEFAPMWWTLADAAGNECDISTIRGRG